MISAETMKIIAFVFRIGNFFRVSPIKLNSKTERLSEVREGGAFGIPTWRIIGCSLMATVTLLTASYIYLMTTDVVPIHEVVVMVCLEIFYLFTLLIVHCYLTRASDITRMYNRFFVFDETFRHRFRVVRVKQDRLAILLKSMMALMVVTLLFEFPALVIMCDQEWKIMVFMLSFVGAGSKYILVTFLTIMTSLIMSNLLCFVLTAILTQDLMIKWLKQRNKTAALRGPKVSRKDSEIFYRSLQLLHIEITALANIAAPGAQILATFILIAIPFCLIEFGPAFDKYTIGMLGILLFATLLLFYVMMVVFAHLREHSLKFPKAHRLVLEPGFRRSCQPLRWKMGTSYYITRNSFLTLLKNFVIRILIKLILTF